MRRGFAILIIFLLILTAGFASAQGTGLSELLNSIDETTLVLFAVFLIVFVLLFFSLKKVFKGDAVSSGIISVMLSLLITYGVNKTGLNLPEFFIGIGVPHTIISTALPIIIIAGIVFLIVKLKKNSLLAIGGLFILLSFFVYAKTLLIVIGVILIVARLFIPKGKWEIKKKPKGFYISQQ